MRWKPDSMDGMKSQKFSEFLKRAGFLILAAFIWAYFSTAFEEIIHDDLVQQPPVVVSISFGYQATVYVLLPVLIITAAYKSAFRRRGSVVFWRILLSLAVLDYILAAAIVPFVTLNRLQQSAHLSESAVPSGLLTASSLLPLAISNATALAGCFYLARKKLRIRH